MYENCEYVRKLHSQLLTVCPFHNTADVAVVILFCVRVQFLIARVIRLFIISMLYDMEATYGVLHETS
jgi:hypothetical protein